ncbi:hypothetical protein JOM56_003557 [Amanita muscaria]
MSVRGTDNLRCYLREAILPEMLCHPEAPVIPPHGHKSHLNHLKARPERWRRLECIQPIDSGIMDKRVTDWIDTHIPDTSLGCDDTDHSTGESLTIPCPPVFDIPPHVEMRPTDIFRMVPWLDNLPLMTVQRTLHLIYPRSRHWTFSLQDVANKDCNIFQYFAWTLQAESRHAFEEADEETKRDIGRYSIVLAFQPPWILSYQDLKEFADCRSFPPYLISGNAFPTPLEGKDRLWAKLWDTCAERRTPWFIITSYHYWVFGAFSRGWTTAFVSRVYEYDYYSPTIAECLTYWASSALHIRGTWRIPEVMEHSSYFMPGQHDLLHCRSQNHSKTLSALFTFQSLMMMKFQNLHRQSPIGLAKIPVCDQPPSIYNYVNDPDCRNSIFCWRDYASI